MNITDIYKIDEIEETSKSEEKKYSTSKAINFEILYLIINRWVGVDGVMAVNSKKELLSLPFLYFLMREHPKIHQLYELSFGLEENSASKDLYENVKGNTLPGLIAFIYYGGSYYILFFLIFFYQLHRHLLNFYHLNCHQII